MPVIKRKVTASNANVLSTLRFSNPISPAAVSLWAVGQAADGTLSFGVDSELVVESAIMNVQSAAGVVDTDRDQILFREPVPGGQYVLDITLGGTDAYYLLVQELP